MKRIITLSTSALLLGSLAACNESGSNGTISLAITDAPVDNADSVVINVTGATLHTSGNDNLEFVFCDGQPTATDADCDNPTVEPIDLMELTGDVSSKLIDTAAIPAGNYQWIRLNLDEDAPGTITIDSTPYDLTIPSSPQNGLKLNNGFTVEEGEAASFTIDFDLRKSVHEEGNSPDPDRFKLRPTLRIVDNHKVGTIEGAVDGTFISTNSCTGASNGAVYLYEGAGATTGVIGSADEPFTTTTVEYVDPNFQYQIGFVEAGEYTLAYTCNDGTTFDETVNSVTVTAGSTTTVNLPQQP